MFKRKADVPYHPSFWLGALGAGGLSISFFMYLMWLVPHEGFPMPTWPHLRAGWEAGMAPLIAVAATLMVALALLHFVLLWWNHRESRSPVGREALSALRGTPAEVQLMALPLTLAMTVNVCFALGAVFVPGLWAMVEYLFPLALAAFAAIGWSALRIYGRYLSRMLVDGGYRAEEHNHLSPLIAVFAFSMLSVGFAAPAAMSHVKLVVALAATLSILFFVLAVVVGLIVLVTGAAAMMAHGLQPKASPSIWMLVPILTLLGIEWLRMQHGLSHHFAAELSSASVFAVLTAIFVLQIGVLAIGFRVMQLNGYLASHMSGRERSPVAFGLICPGVAIVVMGMFWWHLAWVDGGIVTPLGVAYWAGIAVLAAVQLTTVVGLFRLAWSLLVVRDGRACMQI